VNDHGNDNENKRHTVTIADVAERAGVSRQTVSRALNGLGEISEETRRRVLEIIHEMGYRPSSIARGLKTRRTLTLGLVVPDIANPFFAEVARGAFEVARAAGYGLLLCNTDEDPSQEWAALRLLEDHRVDGVVLCSSRLDDLQLADACRRCRPVVVVNRTPPELAGVGCVQVADRDDARQAVRYLHSLGHQAMAFVGGTEASQSSRGRRQGFVEALTELGPAAGPVRMVDALPNVEGGRAAAQAVLTAWPEVTALLAFNDLVAVGCVQACQAARRPVPNSISVLGWDDIIFAPFLSPPLTTVRLPKHEIGVQALRLLLELVRDPTRSVAPLELAGELVVRCTTAPPMHQTYPFSPTEEDV